jgi:LPXTG-site transpeptidase (sortase) family protein
MDTENEKITKSQPSRYSLAYRAGIVLVAMSALILFWTFYPAVKEEIRYQFSNKNEPVLTPEEVEKNISYSRNAIIPVDVNFGIVIPKISANSKVIADVDPNNSAIYQRALTQGVAQAQNSSYPDENGNVFIFAHSGADFYEAAHYNAVFYLLNKLEPGDEIFIFYKNNKFLYKVTDIKTVTADSVRYLNETTDKRTLTLMTCWPPGTSWKRLIVIAEQQS